MKVYRVTLRIEEHSSGFHTGTRRQEVIVRVPPGYNEHNYLIDDVIDTAKAAIERIRGDILHFEAVETLENHLYLVAIMGAKAAGNV